MENNRNRNGQSGPASNQSSNRGSNQNPDMERGFEGMNFEEQRGRLKNSDGAGVKDSQKGSRNGLNNRQDM